jgi:hypothetical protein
MPPAVGREQGWPRWVWTCLAIRRAGHAGTGGIAGAVGRRGDEPIINTRLFANRYYTLMSTSLPRTSSPCPGDSPSACRISASCSTSHARLRSIAQPSTVERRSAWAPGPFGKQRSPIARRQNPPIIVPGQGPGPTAPAYQNPVLNTPPGIDVAIGTYDLRGNAPTLTAITERQGLQNAGVPFRRFSVDGGHTWQFWRLCCATSSSTRSSRQRRRPRRWPATR